MAIYHAWAFERERRLWYATTSLHVQPSRARCRMGRSSSPMVTGQYCKGGLCPITKSCCETTITLYRRKVVRKGEKVS